MESHASVGRLSCTAGVLDRSRADWLVASQRCAEESASTGVQVENYANGGLVTS